MSELSDFVEPIENFSSRPAPFQLEAFAWYLHEVQNKDRVTTAELAQCFDALHIARPANVASSLSKLCERKPARFLRDTMGYRLAAPARKELGQLLPVRATAAKATHLLNELVGRITNPEQKAYLAETLTCFRYGAYRAAVVMAWNVAFSDLLDRIFAIHLPAFNSQVGTFGLKAPITKREDFAELREGVVLQLARNAKIIGKESFKTLDEKLGKRNSAAHPSNTSVSTVTAEEVIFDLVENIILKSPL